MRRDDKMGLIYIVVTLMWSWGVLFIPAALGLSYASSITQTAFLLAGASPSVIALLFVIAKDRACFRAFLLRVIRPDYIRPQGYAAIFLCIPTVTGLSLLTQKLFFAIPPDWSVFTRYLQNPLGLILFALFSIVYGPLAEELGWRGYLLDRLEHRGILISGAVVGCIWTLWHLPMFFIAGTYQNRLLHEGIVSVAYFVFSTIALGVLLSKLVLSNNRSILAAILFHFMGNFVGELFPLSPWGLGTKTILLTAIALWILFTERKNIPDHKEGPAATA